MKTCVLVPTHNRFDLFKKTLDSLLAQRDKNFEVFVSDDSSSDQESESILTLCSKEHKVNYFKSGVKLGQSKNTNFGLKKILDLSDAKFVKILHSDDLIHPDCLEIERKILDKTGCGMAFNDIIPFMSYPKLNSFVNFKIESPFDILTTWANIGCAVPSSMTFEKTYLSKILMNEHFNFTCDWQFFMDILLSDIANARMVCHISPGLIGWRIHENSTTNSMYADHYREHKEMMSQYCDSKIFEEIFSPLELEAWRVGAKKYRESRYKTDKLDTKIFLKNAFKIFEESNVSFISQSSCSHIENISSLAIVPFDVEWSGNGWNHISSDLFVFSAKYDNYFSTQNIKKHIKESKEIYFYHPNKNRFFRKIVYETCRGLKVGIKLFVKMFDNKYMTTFGLKSLLEEMFPGDYKFMKQSQDESGQAVMEFERVGQSKKYHSEIFNGISICYISQGKRPDHDRIFVEKYEKALSNSNINSELIVVSPKKSIVSDISNTYLECPESMNLCKKKNMSCKNASFSDILVLHDRYFLPEDFFERYRVRANKNFSLGCCKVMSMDDRGLDWAVVTSKNYAYSNGGLLPYRAYSDFSYAQGGATFIKKMFWEENPWNENIDWKEHEDVELSRRAQRKGEIISLLDVYVHSLQENYPIQEQILPYDEFNEILIGPPKGENSIIYV